MLFLLNDAVLDIDPREFSTPLEPTRFRALTLNAVIKLGAEMFAEAPTLQRSELERAKRLAFLIQMKAPEINAALFVAPAQGCQPDEVISRFACVALPVMGQLDARQREGQLDAVSADKEVWRRLAA